MHSRASQAPRRAARLFAALSLLWFAACDTIPMTIGAGGPRIDVSDPVPVALLVPRSGSASDAQLATALENAARLAMADLRGAEIDLRVYDTGGNAGRAASVASQAVNDGAKVILGPVYAAAAASAGVAAAARGVNVLAFSNNTDVAGGNVFVLGNTFENTADRLVGYAARQGRRSIMVVNSRDAAEQKGRAAILAAIRRNGATLAAAEEFEASQNGLVEAVPRIAATAQSVNPQAIFFTSGTAGGLPLVTELLDNRGVSSDFAQFIGLQRWDIPASALALPSLQGGWFALPDPGLTAQFRGRYEAAYGTPPHPIASLAYDGIAAIGALVAQGRSNALTGAALTQPTGFSGVNGVFRLRPDGTNQRGLAVATIEANQVRVIDPAPRSFGGVGF